MASRSLAITRAVHAARAEDAAKAAELAEQFTGWHVFSSRNGVTRVASRTGDQKPPSGDDDVWAQTLLADSWADLEQQLAEQAQHDAELASQVRP
jgi:hypothetical protein